MGCEFIGLKREKILKEVYSLLRFDILQRKIDMEYQEIKNSSKTIESEGDRDEKENFEAVSWFILHCYYLKCLSLFYWWYLKSQTR